ncbi:MAG: HNH endonuclease signature motif containing protein [Nanoarchaeota archaeon]
MARYPRISDTPDKRDGHGNTCCRNCDRPVAAGRKHYCSQRCMEEFNRNHSWLFVRGDVLRRDHFRCSICQKRFRKAELEVDHIIPVRMGGDLFDKDNLRTLCRGCHKAKSKLDGEALSSL